MTKRHLKAVAWLFSRDPFRRRRVRHELARLAASMFGDFPLSDDYKLWREDADFLANYRRLSPDNPYSQDRKFTLREFVRYTADVPGDIAECGCYQGASAWFMATEASGVAVHLFDSFEGLSAPDEEDAETPMGERYWNKGDLSTTEKALRENLAGLENIHVYAGWIPERFPEVEDRKFRLVHIDVDLYQPTMDSLEFFFPRLSEHGVIIMDDYGSLLCPGAEKAAREFASRHGLYVIHLPTAQGVIIKR